jgi:two-component system, response regulator YesN
MYKVFLVEDEPPILEMIQGMIQKGNYGFQVTGTAYNGRDALNLIAENPPDVLITDIQMPFLDGLALITKMNEMLPNIKTVILSGYSDFEYARTALRLKVFDYILKPVHPDGLTPIFKRLKDLIDREKLEQECACLNSLINGSGLNENEKKLIQFEPLYYYPVLICAGTLLNQIYDLMNLGRDFWLNSGTKAIERWGNDLPIRKFRFLNGTFPNEKILFLALEILDNHQIAAFCRKLLSDLTNDLLTINIIIGSPIQQISQSRSILKKVRSILEKKIVFGQSQLFTETDSIFETLSISPGQKKSFDVLAQQTDFLSFQKCLKVLLDECKKMSVTQFYLEHLLDRLNETFNYTLDTNQQYKIGINDLLSDSMTYDELFDNCCEVFKYYYDAKAEKSTIKTAKELVDQIENYIIQHYNENITYKTFYNLYGYNETYITNVFRSIKGISPSKFVTKLRIEKAQEIISAQPEILLKTVAVMVGYDDPLYFSRVFKEFTGVNPSEYISGKKKI